MQGIPIFAKTSPFTAAPQFGLWEFFNGYDIVNFTRMRLKKESGLGNKVS
jgi:hypothetical protein